MLFRYTALVLMHGGFLHLIRECDIFREFHIYTPAENYVTDFSLYIRAVGARPQKERKWKLLPIMTADWRFPWRGLISKIGFYGKCELLHKNLFESRQIVLLIKE